MDTQYLKNVLKYTISVFLSVILIAYIMYHISGGFQENIETIAATVTTKEKTVTLKAILFKEETVLYSKSNGEINYLYDDGDKVGVSSTVAEIYNSSGSENQKKELETINRKLKILESSNINTQTETKSVDKEIWNNIYSFTEKAQNGDISGAISVSDDLLIQLNKRRLITGGTKNYNTLINNLKAQKNQLISGMSFLETSVSTENSGYFYSAVDGYENIFSSQNIDTLSYSDFTALCSCPADDFSNSSNGYPIGKLVTDFSWYAACEIPYSSIHNFETNKYYEVKFPYNDDIVLKMLLYRIITDIGNDSAVLVFQTDINPSDFNYLRTQTVQIVQSSYTGYKIPVSALHIEDGKNGVYILRGSKVYFRTVKPIFEYDGYLIVREKDSSAEDSFYQLAKNDFVIVKGKNLYDGKIFN